MSLRRVCLVIILRWNPTPGMERGLGSPALSPSVAASAGTKMEAIGRCGRKECTLANARGRPFLNEAQSRVGVLEAQRVSTRGCPAGPRGGQLERRAGKGPRERRRRACAQAQPWRVQRLRTEGPLACGPKTQTPSRRAPPHRTAGRLRSFDCLILPPWPSAGISPSSLLSLPRTWNWT